jgi:hypothetical protein
MLTLNRSAPSLSMPKVQKRPAAGQRAQRDSFDSESRVESDPRVKVLFRSQAFGIMRAMRCFAEQHQVGVSDKLEQGIVIVVRAG